MTVSDHTKRCSRCKKRRPRDHFNVELRSRDGLDYVCRKCRTDRMAELRGSKTRRPNATKTARAKRAAGQQGKTCSKCREYKRYSAYNRLNGVGDGYQPACRVCVHNAQNAAYQQNRDERRARARALYWKHRETILKRLKERGEIPYVSLARRVAASFHQALRRKGLVANERGVFRKLPYTRVQLRGHLMHYIDEPCEGGCGELVTLAGAHIDHITPLSSARSEKDVIRLNALSNLRLLCGRCNMRKSDRREAA